MSSQPTCNVHYNKASFHVKEMCADHLESLRETVKLNGILHWTFDGETRMVCNAVLADVLEAYDFWMVVPEAYSSETPRDVGMLYWGDTQLIPLPPPLPR
jgi:hypothetical protein